jgi:DNA-binding PucR family transcriptional regulator
VVALGFPRPSPARVVSQRSTTEEPVETPEQAAEHQKLVNEVLGRAGLRESVSQAAPILANLRDLARAEFRASTDALTALPNQRTVKDTVKRMAAHTYEP